MTATTLDTITNTLGFVGKTVVFLVLSSCLAACIAGLLVPAGLNLLAVITPFSLSSLPFYFDLIIFFISLLVVAAVVSPLFFDADTLHSDFGEDLVEVMRSGIKNNEIRCLNYGDLIA